MCRSNKAGMGARRLNFEDLKPRAVAGGVNTNLTLPFFARSHASGS